VRALIELDADVEALDPNGETPLVYAALEEIGRAHV
jgi:ankyrin repeat protein